MTRCLVDLLAQPLNLLAHRLDLRVFSSSSSSSALRSARQSVGRTVGGVAAVPELAIALFEIPLPIGGACAGALEAVEFAVELEDEFPEFLELHTALLDLDFVGYVLLEGGIDVVGCELGEAFLEKVDAQFDVEVFLLEVIDVLHTNQVRIHCLMIRCEEPSPGLGG